MGESDKALKEAETLLATVPEEVKKTVADGLVSQVSVLRGVSLKATGMNHKFKPPTSLLNALAWLVGQEGQGIHTLDFTFLYTNGNGLIFIKGQYKEFENMEEDEAEANNNNQAF